MEKKVFSSTDVLEDIQEEDCDILNAQAVIVFAAVPCEESLEYVKMWPPGGTVED